MIIIGIDPGYSSGGIAFIKTPDLLSNLSSELLPIVGGRINGKLLSDIIKKHSYSNECFAFVENVGSRPSQGIVSAFKFGYGLGVIIGILSSLDIPFDDKVSPAKWKKSFDLIGKDKDEARITALKLWPSFADQFKLKKYIDRADASLIALYGARKLIDNS